MGYQNDKIIRSIFQNAGCSMAMPEHEGDGGPDILVNMHGVQYAAMIKILTTPRTDDVIGRFSTLILERQYQTLPPSTKPLLVVAVSRWGAPMIDRVRNHMKKYAPATGWALIDHVRGAIHMEPAVDDKHSKPLTWYSEKPLTTSSKHGAKLFTDLNAWLLKVLIYKDAPNPYRTKTPERVINPNHLASLAAVSQRTAYSFFNAFENMNFVRSTKNKGIHLVRLSALLEMWFQDAALHSPVRTHACSIFGELNDWKELTEKAGDLRFALGGFGACRIHDVLHTNAKPVWDVHVEGNIPEFEKNWNLQPCGEQKAQISFIESSAKGSVFRGVVRKESLPVVDVIQSALDVSSMPGRGLEQAEHIASMVNQWIPQ